MESWDSVILYSLCVHNVDVYLRSSSIPQASPLNILMYLGAITSDA